MFIESSSFYKVSDTRDDGVLNDMQNPFAGG